MIADLRIASRQCNGKTILQDCFCTPPFKVLDITEDKRNATLHLMLMNASPGVLDGDLYNLQLHLAAGSSVRLHTQSYQRLFPMKKGAATKFGNLYGSWQFVLLCTASHGSA
jgi:urease accessory protein